MSGLFYKKGFQKNFELDWATLMRNNIGNYTMTNQLMGKFNQAQNEESKEQNDSSALITYSSSLPQPPLQNVLIMKKLTKESIRIYKKKIKIQMKLIKKKNVILIHI